MRTKWIFWVAFAVQFCWAVGVASDPSGLFSTPVSGLHDFFRSRWLLVVILTLSALGGCVTTVRGDHTLRGVLLMLPTQFVLLIAAFGSAQAIRTSQFADGVVRPSAFIFTDQSLMVIVAVGYTLAMIETFGGRTWKQ